MELTSKVTVAQHSTYSAPPILPPVFFVKFTVDLPLNVQVEFETYKAPPLLVPLLLLAKV